VTSSPAQHPIASNCHNCGAAVDYHYCAVCGQETKLHVPSASEFIHEFIGHYVALEGRLWKTLAYLLFRPGFLTAEYIAGRRVRYVEPLRIYLTFSILFFAVLKFAGPPVADYDLVTPPVPKTAKQLQKQAEKDAERQAAKAEREVDRAEKQTDQQAVKNAVDEARSEINKAAGKPALQVEGADGFNQAVANLSPALGDKLNSFTGLPRVERNKVLVNAFYAYVPYAMFCLMPLFAFYMKVLYLGSGRRYGEHLLFALHTNAFAFAMIGTLILVSFLDWGVLTFALLLWLIFYLPKAMRRVYGGGRLMTGLRWIVLVFAHLLSIGAAIVSAFGMAVLG
jgi:hypothetical protein